MCRNVESIERLLQPVTTPVYLSAYRQCLLRLFVTVLSGVFVQGCANRGFMPTPNLFVDEGSYTTAQSGENTPSPNLEVLYVTDRATTDRDSANSDDTAPDEFSTYGNSRSASAAFGVAQVALKPGIDWSALSDASDGDKRNVRLNFGDVKASEIGRYPDSPYLFDLDQQGKASVDSKTLQNLQSAKEQFRQLVVERLEQNATNDVVLFIHGFNNSFDFAAQTLSGIWHFLQRRQVPILYSWPAGVGGIRGYFVDSESGQFTIFHLKETLRTLFEIPEIDNIHIIAHSRGTDVITTAMRELLIEHRRTEDPKEYFKIANLILAAPDLDYGVVRQRLLAEQFGTAFGQITVYTTSTDKALSLSQFFLRSIRFGLLASNDVNTRDSSILENVGNVGFILATNVKSFTGHDYYFSNPAVSSDLLTVINHSAKPGTSLRPLTHQGGNFWLLNNNYPEP